MIFILLIFYFIYIHSLILHYNINGVFNDSYVYTMNFNKSNTEIMIYIFLAVILWLYFNFDIINKYILSVIKKSKVMKNVLKEGKNIDALILNSYKVPSSSKYQTVRMDLEFKNLNGEDVIMNKYSVIDSKPELNRFKEGNIVPLKTKKVGYDYMLLPKDVQISFNPTGLILPILVVVFNIIFIIGLLYVGNKYESLGNGMKYLSILHPLITVPGIYVLFNLLLGKFSKHFNAKDEFVVDRLFIVGNKTTAELLETNPTGTLINDNPEYNLLLRFKDHKNYEHIYSNKKLILLQDLNKLVQTHVDILYDIDDPKQLLILDL